MSNGPPIMLESQPSSPPVPPTSPLSSLPASPTLPPESFSSTTSSKKRKVGRPRIERNNMEQILDLIQSMTDYTLHTFLEELLSIRDIEKDRRCSAAFGQFRKFAYSTVPSKYSLREIFPDGRQPEPEPLKKWHMESISDTIRKEFRMLAKEEQFGPWTTSLLSGDSDLISKFTDMSIILQTVTPIWLELLHRTGTGRSNLDQEEAVRKISSDVVLPTSIILRMSRPRVCDGFTTCLGIFAYDAGLTASGLNLFSSLGICCSHRVVLSRLREAEQLAVENACKLGQSPTAVVSYDNFDFAEGRRGERIGDEIRFRSITNAMVAADRLHIETPFSKEAWQPHKRMLAQLDVGHRLGPKARVKEDTRLFFIERCIKSLVDKMPGKEDITWSTTPPRIDVPPPEKTNWQSIRPIMKDENSAANNIHIIENIFREQFRLEESQEQYRTGIRLLSGDLKTWQLILSARSLRIQTSSKRADSLEWALPVLGLWHIRYNMIRLIHEVHWGGPVEADPSTLQLHADRLSRHRVVDSSKNFSLVEQLIIESYHSRVVAMFFFVLEEQGVEIKTIDDLVTWLRAQDKAGIRKVICKVADLLNPNETVANEMDHVFHNHQMFCAHVERYLVLKEAVKYGDIGLLRDGLRHAAVLFNSGVTSTPKYAQALLYMIHLVDSKATSEAFQRFVLANMLVNLRGKADGFIENDRCLELENNRHRRHITRRTMVGTPDTDKNIATWALMGRMLDKFRTAIQLSFGWRVNRDHAYKNAYEDIFAMAQYLSGSSIRPRNSARPSRYKVADLVKLAYKRIPNAITEYNKRHCQQRSFIEEVAKSAEDEPPADEPTGLLEEADLPLLDPDDERMVFDNDFGLQNNDDIDISFITRLDCD